MADPGRLTTLHDDGLTEGRALTLAHRLSAWLPGALLLFVVSAFALPKEPAYALVFYVAVLPCLLARLAAGPWPRPVLEPGQVLPGVLALALIVWSGLTLLWGVDDGGRSWRFAGDTAATLAFVMAMLLTLPDPVLRRRLATILVVAGALNAAFAIAVFVITHPVFPRLRGWGATSHVILGASVMAMAALTALARGLAPAAPFRHRVLNLLAFAIMAAFILMTESRGPLLAASIGVVLLCAASVWRVRAFAGVAALVAVWFLLPSAARHHGEAVMVERGSSHRFEVWRYTLGLIRDRPIAGHGLAANLHLDVGDQITFPHDLYLSLLFYSGAIGFVLFVAMAASITWRLLPRQWPGAWRDPQWAWLVALWANLLVTGLTDLGQITKGPGPLWFIVWLPVGLLLTGRASSVLKRQGSALDPLEAGPPDLR